MKTKLLLLSFLIGIIVIACTKREQTDTTNNPTIVGVWRTDSSIYERYEDNVLAERSVDGYDESEEETSHFLEDKTVVGYYVEISDFGMRDTIGSYSGTYTFNAAAKELVVRDDTGEDAYTVRTLTQQKMVIDAAHNNVGGSESNKETIVVYLSRVQ